jgi:ATP-dependent HslUV protease, peptidase subunit HslV
MMPVIQEQNGSGIRGTTVLMVRREGKTVLAGDGQVTIGSQVLKHHAKKVRRLYNDKVITGFAGATADAFTLYEKFEQKLETHAGNLRRAAVELAKDWRTDKMLRQLQALMIVANSDESFLISGTGDVVEPDEGVMAIGSGAPFAEAAAKALLRYTDFPPRKIAELAMQVASEMCIYTNQEFVFEELG